VTLLTHCFAQTFYNVYAICGFAAIGGALFGFDISSMSGVLGTRELRASSPPQQTLMPSSRLWKLLR
jgi:hypothetical protein